MGLTGPGSVDVLPIVESDLREIAARVIEKARELCVANQVNDVINEAVEGDPRNVLCEAVEKYQADVLVVGSHGYGAIKRAVLGSVSDYCAHHANCTVMIVKKPKTKH
ncbi:uncharacterized protein A4U43_C08F31660 [Asparagus officinalis]|nr:uncharacterized protein A4U43_C08F31660 [Asparagus officinalis]